MAKKCSWCNGYIGDKDQYWFHNVTENGKQYKSKEIFCSPKCSHEYPYRATPDKSNSTGCLIIIIIVIIIYYLSQ
jgi:hypothetical protein